MTNRSFSPEIGDERFFVPLALTLLMAAGFPCSGCPLQLRQSPDFSKFTTYKWVLIKDAATVSDLVDKQNKECMSDRDLPPVLDLPNKSVLDRS